MTTIGMALIVRNEEANMRRLLPLLLPHLDQVVVVDTGSEDNTKAVAQELGAEVYEFPWIDDYSAARNFSFSKLTTDWLGWTDADDEWVGIEKVRACVQDIAAEPEVIHAIWLRYLYDFHEESGQCIAEHYRERFLRRDYGWHWVKRVHEHMITNIKANMAYVPGEEIFVVHKRDRRLDDKRNKRNVRMLMLQRKDDPTDPRTYFDLASQFYHAQNWPRCLAMFRHYLKLTRPPVEGYQALHRMADAYLMLGKTDQAIAHNLQAIQINDSWADAWYGLAECAMQKRQWQSALRYNEVGRRCERPNPMLVLNPLDYEFHPGIVTYRSYGALGDFPKAIAQTKRCLEIVPTHPESRYALSLFEQAQKDNEIAEYAIKVAQETTPEGRGFIYRALPDSVRRKRKVRDELIAPILLKQSSADVVIFCGQTLETWGPATPATRGIGGSETAVIEVAKRLGERGVNVAVYNQCAEQEGQYGNVRYIDVERFDGTQLCKLLVAWRNPLIGQNSPGAQSRWLWMHDLNVGDSLTPALVAPFDLVRPVSAWHGYHLAWLYPFMTEKIVPTRNGIDLSRFASGDGTERISHRAVWCSSPDRGLQHLLEMWSAIREYVEDAELHIFYGFENLDKTAQLTNNGQLLVFKQHILSLAQQPGVVIRGRQNQVQLVNELRQASILAYSTDFLEVSCITSMECMAAGTVVLSTKSGALPETVQSAGLLVAGHPKSDAYRQVFAKDLIALMQNPEQQEPWRDKGYKRAQQFSWEGVVDEWLSRIEGRFSAREAAA